MPSFLQFAGNAIDAIRINSVRSEVRSGKRIWIKKRRPGVNPIIHSANAFFRLARNPISLFSDVQDWLAWEFASFQLLHPERLAFLEDRAFCSEELQGKSLSAHLESGSLSQSMLEAAADELRRAHGTKSESFPGGWSHGDPHLGNLLYDNAGRVRLLDFEVSHDPSLEPRDRHADDLLVIVQDLIGRVGREAWPELPLAFLRSYGCPETLEALCRNLKLPSGIPRLWWAIRTSYMSTLELERRLGQLRAAL